MKTAESEINNALDLSTRQMQKLELVSLFERRKKDAERSGYERGIREAAEVCEAKRANNERDRFNGERIGCVECKIAVLSLLTKPKDSE